MIDRGKSRLRDRLYLFEQYFIGRFLVTHSSTTKVRKLTSQDAIKKHGSSGSEGRNID